MSSWRARSWTRAKTAVGVGVAAALVACGGGGGGNSTTSSTTGGSAGAASVSGVASKGLLLNGLVTAYAINPDGAKGSVLATTSTNATDGSYTLTGLPAGTLVLLEVTPQAGTKMVDEATNATVDVPVSSGFKLRAAATLDSTGTTSAQITPFTDMAVKLAESNNAGKLSADVVAAANGSVSAFVGVSILADKPTFTTTAGGNVVATNAAGAKLAAVSKLADSGAVTACAGDTVSKVKCVVDYLSTQGTSTEAAGKLQTAVTSVLSDDVVISNPLEQAKASSDVSAQPTTLTVVAGTQTGVQEAKALIKSVRATAAALSNKTDATSLAARIKAVSDSVYDVSQPLDDGTLVAIGAVDDALTKRSQLLDTGEAVSSFNLKVSAGLKYSASPYVSLRVGSGCTFYTDNTFNVTASSASNFLGCRVLQQVVWAHDANGQYVPSYAVFHRLRLSDLSGTQHKLESVLKRVALVPTTTTSGGVTTTSYAYDVKEAEISLSGDRAVANVTSSDVGATLSGDFAPGVVKTWTYNAGTGFYEEGIKVLGTKQVVAVSTSGEETASTLRQTFSGSLAVYDGTVVQSQLALKAGSYAQAKRVFLTAGPVEGQWVPDEVHLVIEGQVKSGFTVSGSLDLSNYLLTDVRQGFRNGAFAGSFTDVGGSAKLFDGLLTFVIPADSGLGATATLNGTIVTTGTNTLTINVTASQPSVLGDYSLSGRYTQGSTTFLLTFVKSESTPANDQLSFTTTSGGVGFVARASDTSVNITKGDVVVGVFNIASSRLVYADGSYEQF